MKLSDSIITRRRLAAKIRAHMAETPREQDRVAAIVGVVQPSVSRALLGDGNLSLFTRIAAVYGYVPGSSEGVFKKAEKAA